MRCEGYAGFNCRLEVTNHPGFTLHPKSGKYSCPDVEKCLGI